MCRTFPDAADLFSGVNALCRYGIYRQSSTSENAVFVEIQKRFIVNSEVRLLSPGRESDPNKSLDDIFKLRYQVLVYHFATGLVYEPRTNKSDCAQQVGYITSPQYNISV